MLSDAWPFLLVAFVLLLGIGLYTRKVDNARHRRKHIDTANLPCGCKAAQWAACPHDLPRVTQRAARHTYGR